MKNTLPLLKVLKGQLDICSKYLDIQQQMTNALVVGDIKRIDAIVKDEQSFLLKIESLENRREMLLKQDELDDLTFGEIVAKHVEVEYKEQFDAITKMLLTILTELKEVTKLNQKLLKQRLSVFENFAEANNMRYVRRV